MTRFHDTVFLLDAIITEFRHNLMNCIGDII
jgi:hypothetical protein